MQKAVATRAQQKTILAFAPGRLPACIHITIINICSIMAQLCSADTQEQAESLDHHSIDQPCTSTLVMGDESKTRDI